MSEPARKQRYRLQSNRATQIIRGWDELLKEQCLFPRGEIRKSLHNDLTTLLLQHKEAGDLPDDAFVPTGEVLRNIQKQTSQERVARALLHFVGDILLKHEGKEVPQQGTILQGFFGYVHETAPSLLGHLEVAAKNFLYLKSGDTEDDFSSTNQALWAAMGQRVGERYVENVRKRARSMLNMGVIDDRVADASVSILLIRNRMQTSDLITAFQEAIVAVRGMEYRGHHGRSMRFWLGDLRKKKKEEAADAANVGSANASTVVAVSVSKEDEDMPSREARIIRLWDAQFKLKGQFPRGAIRTSLRVGLKARLLQAGDLPDDAFVPTGEVLQNIQKQTRQERVARALLHFVDGVLLKHEGKEKPVPRAVVLVMGFREYVHEKAPSLLGNLHVSSRNFYYLKYGDTEDDYSSTNQALWEAMGRRVGKRYVENVCNHARSMLNMGVIDDRVADASVSILLIRNRMQTSDLIAAFQEAIVAVRGLEYRGLRGRSMEFFLADLRKKDKEEASLLMKEMMKSGL